MLVTLEKVKKRLKIADAVTTHDEFLTTQIEIISTAIENYCNRSIEARNFEETVYGEYQDRTLSPWQYTLFHYPIITLTSVELITASGNTVNSLSSDFIVHKPTATVRMRTHSKNVRPYLGQTIIYKYRAGYEVIPADIQDVVMSLVSERYTKFISGVDINFGSDVQSVSIPGVINISYDYSLDDNNADEMYGSILGKYRNTLAYYRSDKTVFKSGELKYCEPS